MRAPALIGNLTALLIAIAAACVAAQAVPGAPVARLGESWLHCGIEFPSAESCAHDLLRHVRSEAERSYARTHALHASAAEIEEVRAYELAFRAHDRAQRERKLVELEQRLTDAALPADERSRLEIFRATLARLARYEADVDAGIEQRADPSSAQMAQWVQRFKLEAALYRRYRGVIGIDAAGLYAHGAHAALVRDYLDEQGSEFLDPDIEAAFRRLLAAPPPIVFRGDDADFTPFWRRAIAPSYMSN